MIEKNKFFLFLLGCSFSIVTNAKVSFKFLDNYEKPVTEEICELLCMGKCDADSSVKNLDWNLGIFIQPNANQEKKSQIIANYQTCLGFGLPYVKSFFTNIKTFTVMIPRGLFITDKEGTYDENLLFSNENEQEINFAGFVKIARPIFEREFKSLKVRVWEYDINKKAE